MFIGMNLGNITEPKPVVGARYHLTIANAEFRDEKKDIRVSIGIDDHLDAPNITHFISLPKADDEPGKAQFKRLMLKRFLVQFKIPHNDSGFEVEDFAGAQANCMLSLTEPDESGTQYNRLVLDKMPGDGVEERT